MKKLFLFLLLLPCMANAQWTSSYGAGIGFYGTGLTYGANNYPSWYPHTFTSKAGLGYNFGVLGNWTAKDMLCFSGCLFIARYNFQSDASSPNPYISFPEESRITTHYFSTLNAEIPLSISYIIPSKSKIRVSVGVGVSLNLKLLDSSTSITKFYDNNKSTGDSGYTHIKAPLGNAFTQYFGTITFSYKMDKFDLCVTPRFAYNFNGVYKNDPTYFVDYHPFNYGIMFGVMFRME